tara:strand:+ start:145 stop:1038 length:894 start_codon:yes stop_codon:yes gene_type:complete
MKILLLGANGQLAKTLSQTKPKDINLISLSKNELNFLDLGNSLENIENINPTHIINAAAYTNVDKAESEKYLAETINAYAPYEIASRASAFGCKFVQISTDFVFSGTQSYPYSPTEEVHPLGVYGESKALGEKLILKVKDSKIIRTSWLYSPFGRNFCLTMLALLQKNSKIKKPLRIVYDQVSCPTSTYSLSTLCWDLILNQKTYDKIPKINHWSDAGIASWYDFAVGIAQIALKEGILESLPEIIPIKSKEFKSDAKRPNYSLLDCDEICELISFKREHWTYELSKVIKIIKSKIT